MDPLGAFADAEWDCFPRMFATEEHDCSAPELLLGGELDDALNIGIQYSTFFSAPEAGESKTEHTFYSLDADHHSSNLQYISQEINSYRSNGSGDDTVFIANPDQANYNFSYSDHVIANNNTSISMDFCMLMDDKNLGSNFIIPSLADIAMEENNVNLNEDGASDRSLENSEHSQVVLQLKRKLDVPELEEPAEDTIINTSEHQKKKPRVSKDQTQVQRCMKNARSNKRNQNVARNANEAEESINNNNNTGAEGQSSSSNNSSEGDINASSHQENSVGGATSNGKTRASRGSATDPQSLYARKRRERINERLRILQNLVPNGTKVDISTMLEDAVHYVKFLQLQIKLLSSDDLWMYAPIAYNGVDIGLNLSLKNCPPL